MRVCQRACCLVISAFSSPLACQENNTAQPSQHVSCQPMNPLFTMACTTYSWNSSAAHPVVPHDSMLVFFSSWRTHTDVLIQHCVVERYRHVTEATQSAFPTSAQCGCEGQHQSYTTQCRGPSKAVRSFFLHGFSPDLTKTVPSKFRL